MFCSQFAESEIWLKTSALHLSSAPVCTMPKFAKNVERLESHHDVGLRVSELQVQVTERFEVLDERIRFILAKLDGLCSEEVIGAPSVAGPHVDLGPIASSSPGTQESTEFDSTTAAGALPLPKEPVVDESLTFAILELTAAPYGAK